MMNQTGHAIFEKLHAQATFLRRRRLALALCGGALLFALPAVLLGAYDWLVPLREPTAFRLFGSLALLAALGFLGSVWWVLRRRPGARQVALRAESECPELMDSLACAAELLEQPPEKLTPLNLALLKQVEQDLADRDLDRLVRRRELPGAAVFAIFAGTLAAVLAALWMPVGQKAKAHFATAVGHLQPGLAVRPGDLELAVGDDLQVLTEVHRGPREQVRVHMDTPDGVVTYDMYDRGNGTFSFEMYGIEADLSYYVSTPTLRSPRYHVRTFRRPRITSLELTVTPPPYTELDEQQLRSLKNLTVPEGSLVQLQLQTNMPCSAILMNPVAETELSMKADDARRQHQLTWTATANRVLQIRLRDDAGHEVIDPASCRLEIIEDFPPIVRVTAPKEESSIHDKDEMVPITAEVTDDYGLRRVSLFLSINGNGWKEQELYTVDGTGRILNQMVADVVRLDGIVEYGDVLSYYVDAADNREPEPRHGRSELRFLEIRPPELPPREADGGAGQDAEQLSVADLIIEQKRLIKQSFALGSIRDHQRRRDLLDALIKAADDLHAATDQRFAKIKESVQQKDKKLGPFEELFDNTVRDMDRAHDLLRKRLPEESVDYQQAVLSHLVKIEIELQKNAVKKKSKDPSQSSGSQQSTAENEPTDQQEQKKAKIAAAINELNELIQRQDNLNRRLGRENAGMAAAEREFLGQKQDNVMRDTDTLNRMLRQELPESYAAARELSKAAGEMLQSKQGIKQDQAANAKGHGEQAKQYLQQSRQLLRDLRQQLAAQQLSEAKDKLQKLRREQSELRQQTGEKAKQGRQGTSREEARAMAEEQDKLEEGYQELIDELEKLAEEMAESNPEGARQLAEGMRRMRDQNTAGKMKRSGNALRYRQLERAEGYQGEVEQALQALSQALEKAGRNSSPVSAEELNQMLAETLENFERLKDADQLSEAEQQKLMDAISKQLQEIAGKLKDKEMQQIAQQFNALGKSPGAAADPQSRQLLGKSAAVLERKLLALALRRKLKLSRMRGRQPPDEYRKLVEEYFKKLSELED